MREVVVECDVAARDGPPQAPAQEAALCVDRVGAEVRRETGEERCEGCWLEDDVVEPRRDGPRHAASEGPLQRPVDGGLRVEAAEQPVLGLGVASAVVGDDPRREADLRGAMKQEEAARGGHRHHSGRALRAERPRARREETLDEGAVSSRLREERRHEAEPRRGRERRHLRIVVRRLHDGDRLGELRRIAAHRGEACPLVCLLQRGGDAGVVELHRARDADRPLHVRADAQLEPGLAAVLTHRALLHAHEREAPAAEHELRLLGLGRSERALHHRFDPIAGEHG